MTYPHPGQDEPFRASPPTTPAPQPPPAPPDPLVEVKLSEIEISLTHRGFPATIRFSCAPKSVTTVLDVVTERLLADENASPPAAATLQAAAVAAQPTDDKPPICPTHGPMKHSEKAPGTYFCSKKLFDGSYCKSKWPE